MVCYILIVDHTYPHKSQHTHVIIAIDIVFYGTHGHDISSPVGGSDSKVIKSLHLHSVDHAPQTSEHSSRCHVTRVTINNVRYSIGEYTEVDNAIIANISISSLQD